MEKEKEKNNNSIGIALDCYKKKLKSTLAQYIADIYSDIELCSTAQY